MLGSWEEARRSHLWWVVGGLGGGLVAWRGGSFVFEMRCDGVLFLSHTSCHTPFLTIWPLAALEQALEHLSVGRKCIVGGSQSGPGKQARSRNSSLDSVLTKSAKNAFFTNNQ